MHLVLRECLDEHWQMPPRVSSWKTLEKGSFATRSFALRQISSRFQGGFLRTHTLSYKYHLVQKEYLWYLLMAVAEKERVFETGACRSPGFCSCFSTDWLGDVKPSLLFWATTSPFAKWIALHYISGRRVHPWWRKIGKTFHTVRMQC